MGKPLWIILMCSAAIMTGGIRLQKRLSAEASQERAAVRGLWDTMFTLESCYMQMPQLQYIAYEGASYCRSYAYSCNNLWPEELLSEVTEGTFCIINAYEKYTPQGMKDGQRKLYHEWTSKTLEPWFTMIMNSAMYLDKENLHKKAADYMKQEDKSPEVKKSYIKDVWGNTYRQLHCQDTSAEVHFNCMLDTMKNSLSQAGDAKPDLSRLSSNETMQLLENVQNVGKTMTMITSMAEGVKRQATNAVAGLKPAVPGPLGNSWPNSALGRAVYVTSWTRGFVGPVSPFLRFPWDQAQPGLKMKKVDLTEDEPKAVCNDGSGAILYLGPLTSKTKWHFHIDGGFFCYDEQTCLDRAKTATALASTKGFENEKYNSGMFDPESGGFPEYTHATAFYCSSDAWMGQIEAEEVQMIGGTILSNGKPGTYFHGFYITQAILKRFLKMGLGSTPGQELWISGCSAGAIAATAMADSWSPRLAKLGVKNPVKIWSVLDNMPIVSPAPLGDGTFAPSIKQMAMKLVGMLYGPGRTLPLGPPTELFLNKDCLAANPGNAGECAFPGSVLPFIRSPNLVLNQLWDNFVTAKTYGFMHPVNAPQYNTGIEVVKQTRETFKPTPSQNFWAISCGDHCQIENPNFWRLIPNTAKDPISAKDMTIQTRDNNLGRVVADTCNHYNCGCIGQSTSYTKLGLDALNRMFEERRAPGVSQFNEIPVPIFRTLAIAADQMGFQERGV